MESTGGAPAEARSPERPSQDGAGATPTEPRTPARLSQDGAGPTPTFQDEIDNIVDWVKSQPSIEICLKNATGSYLINKDFKRVESEEEAHAGMILWLNEKTGKDWKISETELENFYKEWSYGIYSAAEFFCRKDWTSDPNGVDGFLASCRNKVMNLLDSLESETGSDVTTTFDQENHLEITFYVGMLLGIEEVLNVSFQYNHEHRKLSYDAIVTEFLRACETPDHILDPINLSRGRIPIPAPPPGSKGADIAKGGINKAVSNDIEYWWNEGYTEESSNMWADTTLEGEDWETRNFALTGPDCLKKFSSTPGSFVMLDALENNQMQAKKDLYENDVLFVQGDQGIETPTKDTLPTLEDRVVAAFEMVEDLGKLYAIKCCLRTFRLLTNHDPDGTRPREQLRVRNGPVGSPRQHHLDSLMASVLEEGGLFDESPDQSASADTTAEFIPPTANRNHQCAIMKINVDALFGDDWYVIGGKEQFGVRTFSDLKAKSGTNEELTGLYDEMNAVVDMYKGLDIYIVAQRYPPIGTSDFESPIELKGRPSPTNIGPYRGNHEYIRLAVHFGPYFYDDKRWATFLQMLERKTRASSGEEAAVAMRTYLTQQRDTYYKPILALDAEMRLADNFLIADGTALLKGSGDHDGWIQQDSVKRKRGREHRDIDPVEVLTKERRHERLRDWITSELRRQKRGPEPPQFSLDASDTISGGTKEQPSEDFEDRAQLLLQNLSYYDEEKWDEEKAKGGGGYLRIGADQREITAIQSRSGLHEAWMDGGFYYYTNKQLQSAFKTWQTTQGIGMPSRSALHVYLLSLVAGIAINPSPGHGLQICDVWKGFGASRGALTIARKLAKMKESARSPFTPEFTTAVIDMTVADGSYLKWNSRFTSDIMQSTQLSSDHRADASLHKYWKEASGKVKGAMVNATLDEEVIASYIAPIMKAYLIAWRSGTEVYAPPGPPPLRPPEDVDGATRGGEVPTSSASKPPPLVSVAHLAALCNGMKSKSQFVYGFDFSDLNGEYVESGENVYSYVSGETNVYKHVNGQYGLYMKTLRIRNSYHSVHQWIISKAPEESTVWSKENSEPVAFGLRKGTIHHMRVHRLDQCDWSLPGKSETPLENVVVLSDDTTFPLCTVIKRSALLAVRAAHSATLSPSAVASAEMRERRYCLLLPEGTALPMGAAQERPSGPFLLLAVGETLTDKYDEAEHILHELKLQMSVRQFSELLQDSPSAAPTAGRSQSALERRRHLSASLTVADMFSNAMLPLLTNPECLAKYANARFTFSWERTPDSLNWFKKEYIETLSARILSHKLVVLPDGKTGEVRHDDNAIYRLSEDIQERVDAENARKHMGVNPGTVTSARWAVQLAEHLYDGMEPYAVQINTQEEFNSMFLGMIVKGHGVLYNAFSTEDGKRAVMGCLAEEAMTADLLGKIAEQKLLICHPKGHGRKRLMRYLSATDEGTRVLIPSKTDPAYLHFYGSAMGASMTGHSNFREVRKPGSYIMAAGFSNLRM